MKWFNWSWVFWTLFLCAIWLKLARELYTLHEIIWIDTKLNILCSLLLKNAYDPFLNSDLDLQSRWNTVMWNVQRRTSALVGVFLSLWGWQCGFGKSCVSLLQPPTVGSLMDWRWGADYWASSVQVRHVACSFSLKEWWMVILAWTVLYLPL